MGELRSRLGRIVSGGQSGADRAALDWAIRHGVPYGGWCPLGGLAEDLTEEIVTGLSRFSYLRVIARGSTAPFSDEGVDVRAVGRELGARVKAWRVVARDGRIERECV